MTSILNLIHRISFRLRYRKLHTYPLSYYMKRLQNIPRVACKDRVVVTFTTIPERIANIDVMIKSILDQTVQPDKIYFCIPEISRRTQSAYVIPDWLNQIKLLEIIKAPQDLGPITKLVPTWLKEKHEENTRIITVDDDYVYSRYLIESLILWSEKFPEAALGLRGVLVPSNCLPSDVMRGSKMLLRDLCTISSSNINALSRVEYFLGYTSVLFRSKFLNETILDYSHAPVVAFFEDDLWIGGHLAKANIDRFIIPSLHKRLIPKPCKNTVNTPALSLEENESGENMDAVYKYLFREVSHYG
jgi:hypothetical protein